MREINLSKKNFLEFHIRQMYKNGKRDTLLGDSRDYMPRIEKFDSVTMLPAYLKILSNAGKGDSLVIRILTDSSFKQSIQQMPSYMDKGGYIYTTIKILNIFETRYQADSANRAELRISGLKIYNKQLIEFEKRIEKDRSQIETDSKLISNYLDKNNIKSTRGKWGTFLVIKEEGKGDKIAYNDVAAVNYTGKTLESGIVFDSNIDPKFNYVEPLEVTLSHLGSVIPGLTDALMQLKNGSKATIYIPSSLAYGKKGKLPKIKPNENLVFDIEITNVITKDRQMEIVSENRRRADSVQQKMNDSLKKAK